MNVSVHSSDDCLYYLDGQMRCLWTLAVEITAVLDRISERENKVSRDADQIAMVSVLLIKVTSDDKIHYKPI